MEHLETKALDTFPQRPRTYYRFVDDRLSAVKKSSINDFDKHLNSQNPYIQFTIKHYDKGIPFLDTLNVVESDGSIKTWVYRKATHSVHIILSNIKRPLPSHCITEQTKSVQMKRVGEKRRNLFLNLYSIMVIPKIFYRRAGER